MNIIYLIGAGASCAMAPGKIPGMQLFGHIAQFFPIETDELKTLLTHTGLYGSIVGTLTRRGSKHLTQLERLNIENVLQDLENQTALGSKDQAEAADKAYNLIKSLLSRLFAKLDAQRLTESPTNTYRHLANAIAADRHGHRHTFISFNYDIWLEQALQESDIWNPVNGYLDNKADPIEIWQVGPSKKPDRLPNMESSQTIVYKPHGSLSWLTPSQDPLASPVLLLNEDGLTEGGKYSRGKPTYLDAHNDSTIIALSRRRAEPYSPLIIPPVQNKTLGGDFLYRIHKDIESEFEDCNAVIIIGWSMPASDISFRQRIVDGIGPRKKTNNIGYLIICNLGKPDLFYHRYRALIPASRSAVCNSGFGPEFIERYMQPLWSNSTEIPSAERRKDEFRTRS